LVDIVIGAFWPLVNDGISVKKTRKKKERKEKGERRQRKDE